jgi:ATP-dependent Clp protease ATP-binding subunit ClpA
MADSQSTDPKPPPAPLPTERFQRVLAFASDEADGLGHGFVTCQHLLYALSRESKGLASAVLEKLSITPDVLHEFLIDADASHDRTSMGRIDLADEARDAIERAVSAASEWKHRVLDTEHLLYGVVAVPTSADEILSALQIDPNDVLNQLYAYQQSAPPTEVREEATHAYRFALESAWLLSLSTDIARRHAARRVTALHVLAALVSLPNPSRDVLVDMLGLSVDVLWSLIPSGSLPGHEKGRLPLAEDVQMILGYAIGEAWNRGHLSVTPMHLAMGLARSERNPALDTLADLGISQAALIDALEQAMPPATGS